MNILFIEDEKELAATGVAQLELKGYTVFPAYDLAEAEALLADPERNIHFLITDHRLPDGLGIQFVIQVKESLPKCKCAVVSGCLTPKDVANLEARKIPYYHKPLLYGNVIDDLRRMHGAQASDYVEPTPDEPESKDSRQKTGFPFWPFKSDGRRQNYEI
jgi:DNA-binding NtrC family response regulator